MKSGWLTFWLRAFAPFETSNLHKLFNAPYLVLSNLKYVANSKGAGGKL